MSFDKLPDDILKSISQYVGILDTAECLTSVNWNWRSVFNLDKLTAAHRKYKTSHHYIIVNKVDQVIDCYRTLCPKIEDLARNGSRCEDGCCLYENMENYVKNVHKDLIGIVDYDQRAARVWFLPEPFEMTTFRVCEFPILKLLVIIEYLRARNECPHNSRFFNWKLCDPHKYFTEWFSGIKEVMEDVILYRSCLDNLIVPSLPVSVFETV